MRLPVPNAVANAAAAFALSAALAGTPLVALPTPAFAEAGKRVIGEIQGSGLVFKDTLRVEAFDDPKVQGVQLYLSDFQRPVTEKLAKGDIFSDPSQGGLSCSHSGKVIVSAEASLSPQGEEVFSEARSLVFKSARPPWDMLDSARTTHSSSCVLTSSSQDRYIGLSHVPASGGRSEGSTAGRSRGQERGLRGLLAAA